MTVTDTERLIAGFDLEDPVADWLRNNANSIHRVDAAIVLAEYACNRAVIRYKQAFGDHPL